MPFFILDSVLIDQIAVLTILGVALVLFIQDRWRYDVVSLLVLLCLVLIGILPIDSALSNFGHPAIIIVASMFVMGRALVQSGIIDSIVSKLTFLHKRPILALGVLVILVTIISAFVNNVGALVMVLPIAIHLAKKSHTPIALYLLPLAFASHLGGYLTLIGTPRNILISNFREEATGLPFLMFDFAQVGIWLAGFGVIFLIFIAWRMIPLKRDDHAQNPPLRIYTTEVKVPEKTKLTRATFAKTEALSNQTVKIFGLLKNDRFITPEPNQKPLPGDYLQLQGDAEALAQFVEKYDLELTGLRAIEKYVDSDDDHRTIEAVITPYATILGKNWNQIPLPERFGVNFIGLARRHLSPAKSLAEIGLMSGDIIMMQGRTASITKTLASMNCMIVSEEEEIALGRSQTILSTLTIFIGAITLASLNVFPVELIFMTAAMLMVITNLISIKQAYESIDVAVLMLLAGMISLGDALKSTGTDETIASYLVSLNGLVGPVEMLFILLVATMLLSDFMNTTAALVVMAPVGIMIANTLGVSVDPFLMVVAVGSAASFLTPVGHESNALVMHRGGYHFRDYFKVGLPLELIQIAITVPLVLHYWPL